MPKSLRILATLLALLLGGAGMAQNNQPQHDRKVVPPPSAVVGSSETAPLERKEAASQKADPRETPLPQFRRPDWLIVYITALYSLIAACTLWVIKRQADTMERQAADATKSATDAALLAEGTLATMREQNRAAREKERARIVVRIVPDELPITQALWRVKLQVRNIGPTRAFDIWLYVKFEFTSSPVPPTIPQTRMLTHLPRIRAEKWRHVFSGPSSWEDEWNEARMQDVAAGKMFLHLRGTVDYQDIFGESHVTPFRYLWNANIDIPYWGDLTPRWFEAVDGADPQAT